MRLLPFLNNRANSLFWGIFFFFLVVGCSELSESVTAPAKDSPTYKQDIQPIFERSCVRCHGGETTQRGFNLSSYETAVDSSDDIIPGDPTSKIIIRTRKTGNMYQYLDSPEESEIIYNWVVLNNAVKE